MIAKNISLDNKKLIARTTMLFKKMEIIPKHMGVLLCLVILVMLLVLNFDKCYSGLYNLFRPSSLTNNIRSGFQGNAPAEPIGELTVEIMPESRSVKVTFDDVTPDTSTALRRSGYLLVLAKFDKNLKEVDALNVKVSKESVPTGTQGATSTTLAQNLTSICNTDNVCSYVFNGLDSKDNNGDLYYYKLGVGVIYEDASNTDIISDILPYRYGSGNRQEYFRIDISQTEQEKLIRRLETIEKESIFKPKESSEQAMVNGESTETPDMDSYMRMLRPFIGNYPDEFTLDKNKLKDLTLDKYLNESMALGQLNVNVDVADLVSKP